MTGDAMAVHESDVGDVRLLEVFGELDLATAPRLCSLLDAARIQRVRRLVVDLTGVDFCDSTGLRALIGAVKEVDVLGGRAVLALESGGMLDQLLDLSGLSEFLRVTDSVEAAARRLAARP